MKEESDIKWTWQTAWCQPTARHQSIDHLLLPLPPIHKSRQRNSNTVSKRDNKVHFTLLHIALAVMEVGGDEEAAKCCRNVSKEAELYISIGHYDKHIENKLSKLYSGFTIRLVYCTTATMQWHPRKLV